MPPAMSSHAHRPTTPDHWAASLRGGSPVISSDRSGWRSGLVRRWTDVSGEISQPPIDHHYVVLHLGGPKHVTRIGAGRTHRASVAEGALMRVPAGTRYEWITVGPIDFAHLYVHPARFNSVIAGQFGRDPTAVTLDEQVGGRAGRLRGSRPVRADARDAGLRRAGRRRQLPTPALTRSPVTVRSSGRTSGWT